MTATYKSKRVPRTKQAEAIRKAKGRKFFAFLMAQRVGKTKVTVDEWGELVWTGKCLDLLVIAKAGVYKTWYNPSHPEGSALLDDLPDDIVTHMKVHVWESGAYASRKAKLALQAFLDWSGPRVLVMNAEALSSVDDARKLCIDFLSARTSEIVIDESTLVKNNQAKRTKFIIKQLRPLAEYRRILTGLVSPRDPLDLFSQFEFLDWRILGHQSFYSFRARYAVMQQMVFGGRNVPIVVGFRDVEELHEKIAKHSFRVRLEDCYDLPPSIYSRRDVPLTKEQLRVYNELREYATAKLAAESHVTATIVITQILRLHQVLCGHTMDEQGICHDIPEKRTNTLLELLEEYEGKAIIWCAYDYNIRNLTAALEKEYGKGSVARFWGGNVKTREQEESLFKNDSSCRFMLATPDAGGWGRTWDVADLVVYHSSKNNLEHRAQSEERPKGVGKIRSIQYVDLISPGTVEEKIIHALRNKINMAAVINGDSWREWLI